MDVEEPMGATCHNERDESGQWWIVWGADFIGDEPGRREHPESLWLEDAYRLGRTEGVELSLQAITDEPEYPSDMPNKLWQELDGNRTNVSKAMRSTVRLTKNGITDRLQAKLKEWGFKEVSMKK